jgi:hypothetical protein
LLLDGYIGMLCSTRMWSVMILIAFLDQFMPDLMSAQ